MAAVYLIVLFQAMAVVTMAAVAAMTAVVVVAMVTTSECTISGYGGGSYGYNI